MTVPKGCTESKWASSSKAGELAGPVRGANTLPVWACMVDRGIFQAFVHQHGTEKLCLLLLVEGRCRGFGKLELLRQSSFGIGLGISQGSKDSFVSKKGIYGCTYLAVDGVVFHTGLLLIF